MPAGNSTAPAAPISALGNSSTAQTPAPPTGAAAAAGVGPRPGPGPDGQRLRDMTPEQRKAFIANLTPQQRAEFQKRREERRKQREAVGADGPDGQ